MFNRLLHEWILGVYLLVMAISLLVIAGISKLETQVFDRRFKPWHYRIYFLPCIRLWISTIYLRYHCLIDLIAGFMLAAFSLWPAFKIHPGDENEIPSTVR